jgi:hypothetical protein
MGAGGGFLVLVFPTLGYALIALGAIGVLRAQRHVAGGAGLFIGIGATMVVLLFRAQLACEAFDAVPNQGCESPDLTPWLTIGGALLVAGVILSALALVGGKAGRVGGDRT